jgi:hypothetical protein
MVIGFTEYLGFIIINSSYAQYFWFPHYKYLNTKSSQSFLGNSSPQWLFLCSVFTRNFLVTTLSNGDSSVSVGRCLTLHRWTLDFTPLTRSTEHGRSSHIASERTYRKHLLHQLFYCCVTSPRKLKLRALHNKGCCLHSHFLATGLYVTFLLDHRHLHFAITKIIIEFLEYKICWEHCFYTRST